MKAEWHMYLDELQGTETNTSKCNPPPPATTCDVDVVKNEIIFTTAQSGKVFLYVCLIYCVTTIGSMTTPHVHRFLTKCFGSLIHHEIFDFYIHLSPSARIPTSASVYILEYCFFW
jgi:hypothetical protein